MVMTLPLVACVPASLSYSHTASTTYPAKDAACDFRVQATPPAPAEYEELGTLGGYSRESDLNAYKEMARPQVCQAGGDVLVGTVNGQGIYVQGIVFRKRNAPPSAAPTASSGSASE